MRYMVPSAGGCLLNSRQNPLSGCFTKFAPPCAVTGCVTPGRIASSTVPSGICTDFTFPLGSTSCNWNASPVDFPFETIEYEKPSAGIPRDRLPLRPWPPGSCPNEAADSTTSILLVRVRSRSEEHTYELQ